MHAQPPTHTHTEGRFLDKERAIFTHTLIYAYIYIYNYLYTCAETYMYNIVNYLNADTHTHIHTDREKERGREGRRKK